MPRLCGELDEKVQTFLNRPLEDDWPDVWLDAIYVKIKQSDRIVYVAVAIAIEINNDGRHEVLGMAFGYSVIETFRTEFLRTLVRRCLLGIKLVISDGHEGLKGAIAGVLNATWQKCRVHIMRNLLAHAGRNSCRLAAAFIGITFVQEAQTATRIRWRKVVNQVKPSLPKLAAFMDKGEDDVLAFMDFPAARWVEPHSTNPIEPPNGEIK